MHPGIKKSAFSKGIVYTEICNRSDLGAYSAYIRGIRCKTELAFFIEISAALQFPYYFGENWPALDECLCDLEWLHFNKMFIVIDDFSESFSDQKEIQGHLQCRVIKYFSQMVDYWRSQNIIVEIWLNN